MQHIPAKRTFARKVLAWYQAHGRKNLPWQGKGPYAVWVSEIMLQQTQVKTVIPYYQRFMKRFPTIHALAKAPLDDVLTLWAGLGYYARARNLHRSATLITTMQGEKFPQTVDALCELPGIGRSTAGAILSLGFGLYASILDGNVKRVLCRYVGLSGWPGKADVQQQLWAVTENLTPRGNTADYTQAMMDLGAMICTRTKPDCAACPLTRSCVARKEDLITELPTKKPKKTLPKKARQFILIQNRKGEIYLQKRPMQGIWGGLWSLPECDHDSDVVAWCQQQLGCQVEVIAAMPDFWHAFTHYKLNLFPIIVKLKPRQRLDLAEGFWYNLKEPAILALPKPMTTLLRDYAS